MAIAQYIHPQEPTLKFSDYQVEIVPSLAESSISALVDIQVVNSKQGQRLSFYLSADFKVAKLKVNHQPIEFRRTGNTITFLPPDALARD